MTTETLIVDSTKFGLDELLAWALHAGSWLGGEGAAFEVDVDHDCYLFLTMPATTAVHFKLTFSDKLVSPAVLAKRRGWIAEQHKAPMRSQMCGIAVRMKGEAL